MLSVSGCASLMTASSAILLSTAWPLPAGQHVYINTLTPDSYTIFTELNYKSNKLHQLPQVSPPTSQALKYLDPISKPPTMKFAAFSTLLFATLTLASPAAQPHPGPAAAAVAQPFEIAARDPAPVLEARKKKPSGGKGNDGNSTSAATDMLAPSRALQLGALGLGVMQITKLW